MKLMYFTWWFFRIILILFNWNMYSQGLNESDPYWLCKTRAIYLKMTFSCSLCFFLPFFNKTKIEKRSWPSNRLLFFDKPEKQHDREGEREILFGFSRFNMQIFQQRNHSRESPYNTSFFTGFRVDKFRLNRQIYTCKNRISPPSSCCQEQLLHLFVKFLRLLR